MMNKLHWIRLNNGWISFDLKYTWEGIKPLFFYIKCILNVLKNIVKCFIFSTIGVENPVYYVENYLIRWWNVLLNVLKISLNALLNVLIRWWNVLLNVLIRWWNVLLNVLRSCDLRPPTIIKPPKCQAGSIRVCQHSHEISWSFRINTERHLTFKP